MDLTASFRDREASLIKLLMSKQAAIDDRTGKGRRQLSGLQLGSRRVAQV
jgi:hypothetical protein